MKFRPIFVIWMKMVFFGRSVDLCGHARAKNDIFAKLVGPSGLEPPTSRLSGVRSNHLSYEPIFVVRRFVPLNLFFIFEMKFAFSVEALGFVPVRGLKSEVRSNWWRYAGSNRRPPACKAGALPAELYPHILLQP